MKTTRREFSLYSFYDHTGIEAHLTAMAARGWLQEKWTYGADATDGRSRAASASPWSTQRMAPPLTRTSPRRRPGHFRNTVPPPGGIRRPPRPRCGSFTTRTPPLSP